MVNLSVKPELTERQKKILKAIVEEYVETTEPVGSKTLTQFEHLNVSSATIRNEMAYLEELGLIYKPHTSSGRVPTEEGYRVYVCHLLQELKQSPQKSFPVIDEIFRRNAFSKEQAIKEAMALVTKLTNYTTIVLGVSSYNTRIKRLQFVPIEGRQGVILLVTDKGYVESQKITVPPAIRISDVERVISILNTLLYDTLISEIDDVLREKLQNIEIYDLLSSYEKLVGLMVRSFAEMVKDKFFLAGQTNILNQPEFQDIEKIKVLVTAIENQEILRAVDVNKQGISVKIGDDNEVLAMKDCTVISVPYEYGENERGAIAVVGPTRMEYQKVIPLLEYIAKLIKAMV